MEAEGEDEDDQLSICELCQVVVHPSCYRRDLFDAEIDDDSPWYCARCLYLLNETAERSLANRGNLSFGAEFGKLSSKLALPNCFMCNDLAGAMVDLKTNEWVHHTCINWHNEVWFETDDKALTSFSGTLDFSRFGMECSLCKEKNGSCISCDFTGCKKVFHVRCAMKHKLILSVAEMEKKHKVSDWDIKVYCPKH